MGECFTCTQTDEDRRNNLYDKAIQSDKKKAHKVKKILFLGSGGSGKSTIFKQLKGIYGEGFNENERKVFVAHIHEQVITQMKLALDVLDEYRKGDPDGILRQNEKSYIDHKLDDHDDEDDEEIPPLSESALEAQDFLTDIHYTSYKLTDEIVSALMCLWSEPAIRKMYDMRNITKIVDSSAYFWNKLEALISPGYVPDEADILLVRYRTTGVTEEKYEMPDGKGSFAIIDVGGQRSERKKWIQCFDSVTAVIFVASLSCYDEVLYEDYSVNSMTDQLQLFDDICNNEALKETSMILFLNKKDLFIEKIKAVDITKCVSFSDFGGNLRSFDQTTKHIRKAFTSLNNMPNRKNIFTHITCATDQDNIQKVFADVQHIVIEASLIQAGLMDWDDNQRYKSVGDDAAIPQSMTPNAHSPMGDPQTASLIRASIMHSHKQKSINKQSIYSSSNSMSGFRAIIKSKSIPPLSALQYCNLLMQYKYNDIHRNAVEFDECNLLNFRYCWAESMLPRMFDNKEQETFILVDMEPNVDTHCTKSRKKLNLCIVLDVGKFMDTEFTDGQIKIDAVKRCIIDIVQLLDDEDRFSLITFDMTAGVLQDIESKSRINIDRLMDKIRDIECESSALQSQRMDYTGFGFALSQFKKLWTQKKVSMEYDNRIVMISTSRLSEKILSDATDAAQHAEAPRRVYASFIGICNGFALQRTEIDAIRGCNYFCIYSSEQLKEKTITRFDEMVTPLMFDLRVTLKTGDDRECVDAVYRVNGDDTERENNKNILELNTLFLTKQHYNESIYDEEHEANRYLLLVKLLPTNSHQIELVISYTDQLSQNVDHPMSISFQRQQRSDTNDYSEDHKDAALLHPNGASDTGNTEYFANTDLRKAILLSRYVRVLRDWVKDTSNASKNGFSKFKTKQIQSFITYFEAESRAINDKSLSKEISVLQSLF